MPNNEIPTYHVREDIDVDDEQDNEPAAYLVILTLLLLAVAVVMYGRLFLQWPCK